MFLFHIFRYSATVIGTIKMSGKSFRDTDGHGAGDARILPEKGRT